MKKYYKIVFYKDRSVCYELSQKAYESELIGYMNNMDCYSCDIPSMWKYKIHICGEWCDILYISR